MDVVRLHSGRKLNIRPIQPDDGPRLQAAYERLSPESRYRRFLTLKPYLSPAEARYLAEIDGSAHFALVAATNDEAADIVAVARFVHVPEHGGDEAEFAIVVDDAYQGDGLGTQLLDQLVVAGRERGITRFRASVLASNEPAHRLMRRLAAQQPERRSTGAVDEYEFELAA
jgi:RimJ/RimL family protein N-acetyltransferase